MKLTRQLLHSKIHQEMWHFWVFIVNPFFLLCSIFFSRNLSFLWSPCLLLISELTSLDTSGKPSVRFFLKITSPSWIILSISLDKLNSIDYWRADDEFSWNNFYFIVVKEFWYGKIWRIYLNIIFWILLWISFLVIWNLNITVSTTMKYCYEKALNKNLKLMGRAMKNFLKKLLGHEIFRSMVSWTTKFFGELFKALGPPSYILNVRSLILIALLTA